MTEFHAPVSAGELIDKITILEIKAVRISDPDKLINVRNELDALSRIRSAAIMESTVLGDLTDRLHGVNEMLWQIEDDIRACEDRGEFGPVFIELARAVYQTNDQRAALKREINELLGSAIVEEKSYIPYASDASGPKDGV